MDPTEVAQFSALRPLKRSEYDRLVESGAFADERVELLCGLLVEMSPQGSLHADVVAELTRLFLVALGGRAGVRPQLPLAVGDDSEPEPDIALVPPGRYRDAHPTKAFLVVEVADDSLAKDLHVKAKLYAAAGIPEYWVVDLRHRKVVVHTRPTRGRYSRVLTRARTEVLTPVRFRDVKIAMVELLPPR